MSAQNKNRWQNSTALAGQGVGIVGIETTD